MNFSLNTQGNLHQTIELSIDDLYHHFGSTPYRKKLLDNAIHFLQLFSSCGCTTAYIGGSFASIKAKPDDIDLCFDLRKVDYNKLEVILPDFFDFNKVGTIHRKQKCHILYFDHESTRLYDMLLIDRQGFPKGLIKLNLKNLESYDQKRKTV